MKLKEKSRLLSSFLGLATIAMVLTACGGGDKVSASKNYSPGKTTVTAPSQGEAASSASVPQNVPQLTINRELTDNADEDGSGDISLGDTLTYTITARNTGNVTLSNVQILGNLIAPKDSEKPCLVVFVDSTCRLTGKYRVTQKDVVAGKFVTISSVTSDEIVTPVVTRTTTTVALNKKTLIGAL